MTEKIRAVLDRYEELEQEISQPTVISDLPRYQACLKEMASLEQLAGKAREWFRLDRLEAEAQSLLTDADLAEEARAELRQLSDDREKLSQEIRLLLIPEDPMDSRNVAMEIRAGVGGEEAALFAGDLLRMYLKFADKAGMQASVAFADETDLGGVSSALVIFSGPGAYGTLKYEKGVHCVKRIPVTESSGRIHTSTATVAVFPEAEDVELEVNPADLKIDVFHASGHGGQGVNTTDSAVRVTHLPTGMVVTCQDERSQLANKNRAVRVLRARLLDRIRSERIASMAQDRSSQIQFGERSDKIRTYYFNHDYVVDHRLGMTVSRASNVMNGDLQPFIDALRFAEKTERLKHV